MDQWQQVSGLKFRHDAHLVDISAAIGVARQNEKDDLLA